MVGELVEWMDDLCYQYGIDRSEIDLYLCEGLDRILPNLNDKLVDKAMKYLDKVGVKVKTGSFVSEVKEDGLTMANGDTLKNQNSYLELWCCCFRLCSQSRFRYR